MPQFQKTDLAQRVATSIRQSIGNAALGDSMPSLRSIALNLGVSVPSVSKAFLLLEEQGTLQACGQRRRWKIRSIAGESEGETPDSGRIGDGRRMKRLLYLTSFPMREWLSHFVEVYADLINAMNTQGWELVHRVMSFQEAKSPHKSWDELFQQERPDAIVVLTGTPVLARWAVGLPVRTLFLGGICDPYPLPMVKVGISASVEELASRLAGLGHRHILVPLCGRSPGFAATMNTALQSGIADYRSSGAEVHSLETPYSSPEVLYDALRKHWQRHRPDALILFDWREFVTVTSFFRDSGISIPKDVSVALMSGDNSMSWHLPKLAHYEFNTLKLAKAVARWAVDESSPSAAKIAITMRAQWRDGGSINDRRQVNPGAGNRVMVNVDLRARE